MIYLWDVKQKTIKRKHFDLNFTLCEFHLGGGGFGIEWNYSHRPSFNRYGKHFWITLQFLWVQVFLSADWGHKQQFLAAMERAKALGVKKRHLTLVGD